LIEVIPDQIKHGNAVYSVIQPRSSLSDQTFRSKSFSDTVQHKKVGGGGWQIHNVNQQIKLNATVIKNVLTSLIQMQFHLS